VSDGITFQLAGLDGLLRELRQLPQAIQTRVVKGMVATGASVIRKEVVARAPMYTGPVSQGHPPPGTLKKAIYQVRLSQECTATREMWKVGVRRGKAARNVKRGKSSVNLDAYYAFWVEFEHFTRVPHAMTKTAKAAGRALGVAHYVPAHPFFRPAVAIKRDAAFQAMQSYLAANLPLAVTAFQYLKAA